MNLMEITKGHEPKQNEQTDQTKNSLDTTDKWKQLAKEQAETLEKVSAERDELQVRNQKMNEFIQEFQERTHKLKMEKQQLFFENHEMQEEMQKSNAEIQQMTVELSEMRKLNQSLQQSKSQLEWSAAIQAGSCRTVDVIHHKVYFLFSKRVKGSSFWEDITYKLMILFQASFLPGGHGVAVKDLCKDILPVRHLK